MDELLDEPLNVLDDELNEFSEDDMPDKVVLELLFTEEGISFDSSPFWQAASEAVITAAVKTENNALNLMFIRFTFMFTPL